MQTTKNNLAEAVRTEMVQLLADLLAERAVPLGGVAEGTCQVVAERTRAGRPTPGR